MKYWDQASTFLWMAASVIQWPGPQATVGRLESTITRSRLGTSWRTEDRSWGEQGLYWSTVPWNPNIHLTQGKSGDLSPLFEIPPDMHPQVPPRDWHP